MRIFFATDIHGSEVCWRKFINAAKYYKADTLILGGDMTGKAVVPIVKEPKGHWTSTFLEHDVTLRTEQEVADFEKLVANRGYYFFRIPRADADDLMGGAVHNPTEVVQEIYEKKAIERIRQWLEWATDRLGNTEIKMFCCPGNDDFFGIDPVIKEYPIIQHGEGHILNIDDKYRLLSLGWTSPTPWNTFREASEDELYQKLNELMVQAGPTESVVCNIHCPPYGSSLDEAPELDEDMRPKYAGNSLIPVGSKAVRKFLEEYQPAVSFHGHIHEGRGFKRLGKRTMAFNPGSQYEQGILLGALVDMGRRGIEHYTLTQG